MFVVNERGPRYLPCCRISYVMALF